MKKLLLIGFIVFCIFQMVVMADTIDVGIPATDRVSSYGAGYTRITRDNPANLSGKITSVEIYARSGYNLANCEVATFFVVSGDNLSTRDTHFIGSVTGGSKQTFSGLDITVEAGDYIGIYYSAGQVERSLSGYIGQWADGGDQIPCTNNEFTWYSDGDGMSLYGTGITIGWDHKWNTITIGKWNTKEFTKWNGLE